MPCKVFQDSICFGSMVQSATAFAGSATTNFNETLPKLHGHRIFALSINSG